MPVSLRIFVVLLVLLGVCGFLWIGLHAYRRHLFIRKIEDVGGVVVTQRGPKWLRDVLGDERMRILTEPRSIWFEGSSVADEDLLLLQEVPNLEAVGLNATAVTDSGLAHLKKVTGLKMLVLDGKRFSDDAIEDLSSALPSLRIRK